MRTSTSASGRTMGLAALVLLAFLLPGAALAATNAWVGGTGLVPAKSWNLAANWSLGHVPLSSEDVVISLPSSTNIAITGADAACSSLALTADIGGGDIPTVALTINSGVTLTVNGTTMLSSAQLFDLGVLVGSSTAVIRNSGTLLAKGDVQLLGFGSTQLSQQASTAVLALDGSATLVQAVDGQGTWYGSLTSAVGSTVRLTGTNATAQVLNVNTGLAYRNVVVDKTSATDQVVLSSSVSPSNIAGNFTLSSGRFNNGGFSFSGNSGQSFQVADGATLELAGTSGLPTTNGAGTYALSLGSNSTVAYLGTTQSVAPASGLSFGNLVLSGGTKTLASDLTVAGSLTVASGATLDAGARTLALAGSWTNNGSFVPGTSTVSLTGTTAQTVGGSTATDFYNLSFLGSSAKTLANNAQVQNKLTLGNNKANNLGGYLLTLGTSVSNVGSLVRSNSIESEYLANGSVRRWYTAGTTLSPQGDESLFPLGDLAASRPLHVAPTTGPVTGGTVTIGYSVNGAPSAPSPGYSDNGQTVVEYSGYNWTTTLGSGLSGGEYTLRAGSPFPAGVLSSLNDLRLVQPNGAVGTAGTNEGTLTFPYVVRTGLTPANLSGMSFYFGSTSGGSSLPVELSRFEARVSGKQVLLSWSTASEKSNDRFEVERSRDGRRFERIGTVTGAGSVSTARSYAFTDQSLPAAGKLYYRLRQVDTDGSAQHSPVRSVRLDGALATAELLLFPTRTADALTLDLSRLTAGENYQVQVLDLLGREHLRFRTVGGQALPVDVRQLPAGAYLLRVQGATLNLTERLVKE